MPDMERLTRSLELHLAQTPERKAFVAGSHAGEDRARKQIVVVIAVVSVVVVLMTPFIHL